MPELKLGTKHNCYNCGTKFYDLGKPTPVCPKCGADQRDSGQSEPAVSQASRRRRKAEVAKPIEIEEEEPIADVADDELVEPELDDDEIAGAAAEDIDDED